MQPNSKSIPSVPAACFSSLMTHYPCCKGKLCYCFHVHYIQYSRSTLSLVVLLATKLACWGRFPPQQLWDTSWVCSSSVQSRHYCLERSDPTGEGSVPQDYPQPPLPHHHHNTLQMPIRSPGATSISDRRAINRFL